MTAPRGALFPTATTSRGALLLTARSAPAAAALALAALLLLPGHPVDASCMPLELRTLPRTADTVVFTGTVLEIDGQRVRMQVEDWFTGRDPRGAVLVVGGRGSSDPTVVTSVDWRPRPGEAYLVVGESGAPGMIVTAACRQAPVSPAKLAEATAVFGEPKHPPFRSAEGGNDSGPATADQGNRPREATRPEPVTVLAAVGLGALAAALVFAVRRRQPPT